MTAECDCIMEIYRSVWNMKYSNNLKYWDRQARANSVVLDQMSQNAVSDQDLRCLPSSCNFLDTSKVVKWTG